MFLLFSYSLTSKQEFQEQLQHWVLWTMSVPNVIQHKVCQEKVIQEYQSLLCWETGAQGNTSLSEQVSGRLRSERVTPGSACWRD